MGLVEDYKKICTNCEIMQKELPLIDRRVETCKNDIAALTAQLSDLKTKASQQIAMMMSQRLAELAQEERQTLAASLADVQGKITEVNESFASQSAKIKQEQFSNQLAPWVSFDTRVQQAFSAVDTSDELMQQMLSEVSFDKSEEFTVAELNTFMTELELASKSESELVSSLEGRISKFALFEPVIKSKMSNKVKFLMCLGLLLLVVLAFVYVPVIPAAGLSCLTVVSAIAHSKETKRLLKAVIPYSKLVQGHEQLQRQIQHKRAVLQQAALQDAERKYRQQMTPLQESLADLNYKQATVDEHVRSQVSEESLRQFVEERSKAQESELAKKLTAKERQLRVAETEASANRNKLEKSLVVKKEMLPKIRQLYLNPTEPGVSPYLIKSFLISVDEENGTLDEFNYNGCSTFIMYKGETSSVNKPLITMMLMQFMASMSLASLEIYLTDVHSAGMDYAPFSLCVTINSDTQGVHKLVEDINKKLVERRDTIAAQAENIEQFNQQRLDTHGLTVPYILLILQDLTLEDMINDSLIQIAVNGPRVGIIPIVFVSHMYSNSMHCSSEQELAKLNKFFAAFRYKADKREVDNTFLFDGVTGDLKQSSSVIKAIMLQVERSK